MMLWFGCYNAVMTSDKVTSLFGNLIPAISLLLVMVLRMIPSFIRKAGQIMGARKSVGLGAGEDSEYGLYVKTVNGVTVDYDQDGKYWAFYVDGEYAATGVDSTDITAGATYTFKAE